MQVMVAFVMESGLTDACYVHLAISSLPVCVGVECECYEVVRSSEIVRNVRPNNER
jgi:hypothetical protein